jgi:hypothetical protein
MAQELVISDQIKKLPVLKQGIAYSLIEHTISYLNTIEVIKWKGIALEAGYSSEDRAVAVVSYELLKLKDLGVTLPVLDLIECRVGAYAGYGRIGIGLGNAKDNNEFDYGLSATLLNIKF